MKTQKKKWQKRRFKVLNLLVLMCLLTFICVTSVSAKEAVDKNQEDSFRESTDTTNENLFREPTNTTDENNNFQLNISSNAGKASLSSTLQILLLMTILTIAPSILLMVTSFTRIIIVLHFVRSALGTQTTPPNQILIGLALFLTFFVMSPVFTQVNENAVKPLAEGKITQEEAIDAGLVPIREFMFGQISNKKDLKLFLEIADMTEEVKSEEDIPTTVLIPAFMISELRKAFTMGFIIYLPFIVIDMVVASTLMSMGMMMLPPTTISMPFKILLFIMADGWNLVVGEVIRTFYIT
ncbi:MAG: flagellar type III secretion system pore protein FliP [Acetivibrio sp.]